MRKVAVLIETSRSYGRELLQGVQRFVHERGQWSISFELRGLDSRPPGWMKSWRGDGILTRTGSAELARSVQRAAVPVVELRTTRYAPGTPFVGVDNQALGKLVASTFLEQGFRQFGVYRYDIEDYFRARSDSFLQAVEAAGCSASSIQIPSDVPSSRQWERHREELVAWLRELPKPVALMACNDQLGYWLLDACRQAGIAVPEQAAVVAAENDETLCAMTSPPLSSVPYDARRIGYAAAQLLDQLMAGEPPPAGPLLLPPLPIVTRGSSDVVAIEDELLSRAIQFIRKSACQGISVHDVLRAVPISRRSLERNMQLLLKRSPHDEIQKIRMDRACHLLRTTDLNLGQVAERCSFGTAQYFCTAFLRRFGQTPTAYRQQQRH